MVSIYHIIHISKNCFMRKKIFLDPLYIIIFYIPIKFIFVWKYDVLHFECMVVKIKFITWFFYICYLTFSRQCIFRIQKRLIVNYLNSGIQKYLWIWVTYLRQPFQTNSAHFKGYFSLNSTKIVFVDHEQRF